MKAGQKNKENANHPWTASSKRRHSSLTCSNNGGRKRTDANRRNPDRRSYETDSNNMW
jgi:hypothetical protein